MPPQRLSAHASRRRATTPPLGSPVGPRHAEVQAMLEAVRTRSTRFEQGSELIAGGRAGEAVPIFRQLVTEDPQNRRYRQRFLLALGLEHRDEGRLDDAIRELDRAHHLDPDTEDVATALRATREQRESGRAGILSRFFGR
jgi:tetratricopeptide (TPR) repeat protein